jgi:hypothetical protein
MSRFQKPNYVNIWLKNRMKAQASSVLDTSFEFKLMVYVLKPESQMFVQLPTYLTQKLRSSEQKLSIFALLQSS